MEVNLRKANALSKALIETAKKLPLPRTASVSIYDTDTPEQVVELAAEKLLENVKAAGDLLDAAYQIRDGIGVANASSGIDAILTNKARLDAVEKMLAGVVGQDDHDFINAASPSIAGAKLEALRKASTADIPRYGATEGFLVQVATDPVTEPLKKRLQAIRREKTIVADQLLGLNTTMKLRLSSEVVNLLEKFELI